MCALFHQIPESASHAQARRTLSGLLRKGKEGLRENDASEAILAAKQVRVTLVFLFSHVHVFIWWRVFVMSHGTCHQHAGTS